MIISSLGSLILALLPPSSPTASSSSLLLRTLLERPASPFHPPPPSAKSPLQIRQSQILLFSIFNTASRLIGGFVADYLSAPLNVVVPHPSARSRRTGWFSRPRVSKTTMLLVVLLPLAAVYFWAAVGGLADTAALPVLTIVVGWTYGCTFTLAPSLVAQVFGLRSFGRCARLPRGPLPPAPRLTLLVCALSLRSNFGIQSYAMAASSLLFTFLYGSLAERHRLAQEPDGNAGGSGPDDEVKVCRGPGCFQGVLACAFAATVLGVAGVAWLRRRWRGRT